MQSTGQTSTHDRSFRLMQGSAMMYGIQAPGNSRRIANIEGLPPPFKARWQAPRSGSSATRRSRGTHTAAARCDPVHTALLQYAFLVSVLSLMTRIAYCSSAV